jgi:hypothetical protein
MAPMASARALNSNVVRLETQSQRILIYGRDGQGSSADERCPTEHDSGAGLRCRETRPFLSRRFLAEAASG